MPAIWKVLVFLASIIFFSALTYYCFHRKYKLQPNYMEKLTELGLMLENYQEYYRENKDKLNDPIALKTLLENNKDLDSNFVDLHVISINIQNSLEQPEPSKVLTSCQDKIEAKHKQFQRQKIIKIVATLIAAILAYFLTDYTVIAIINFLFFSNSTAETLKTPIDKWIPHNMQVEDAITQEVNFPAWNINLKRPAFFSKIAKK